MPPLLHPVLWVLASPLGEACCEAALAIQNLQPLDLDVVFVLQQSMSHKVAPGGRTANFLVLMRWNSSKTAIVISLREIEYCHWSRGSRCTSVYATALTPILRIVAVSRPDPEKNQNTYQIFERCPVALLNVCTGKMLACTLYHAQVVEFVLDLQPRSTVSSQLFYPKVLNSLCIVNQ